MSSPHDHAEKQVAVEDVSASSHLELTTTTTTQGMDGSNYHDILPKPSNDPNDPLVSLLPTGSAHYRHEPELADILSELDVA